MKSGAGEAAARVAFHQTDLRAHPLHDATVVWYGPQPDTAKIIAPELLPRLRHERPVGSTTRLLMTGAFLPPEAEGARLNTGPSSSETRWRRKRRCSPETWLNATLLRAVWSGGKTNGRRVVVEHFVGGLVSARTA